MPADELLSEGGADELARLLSGFETLDRLLRLPDRSEADGDESFGPYRVRRRIGGGRFGVVFLADHAILGRRVALKVPQAAMLADPTAGAKFLAEARKSARLDHPGVVPVFEAGEVDGLPYLAAGYVGGPTLADWLKARATPADPRDAARFISELARAVHHAHDRGVIHCDLKPANVLLVVAGGEPGVGSPRVADFGLARILEDDPGLSRSLGRAGTVLYMAPEQARGERVALTARADVYALGAILFELLTLRPPFPGEGEGEVLARLLTEPPPSARAVNRGVARDLDAVCRKCRAQKPGGRYESAAALSDDLDRFLNGEPTLARPPGLVERVTMWARRRPAAATAVATLAAALLTVAVGTGVHFSELAETNARLSDANDALRTANGLADRRLREGAAQAYRTNVRYGGDLARDEQYGRLNDLIAGTPIDDGEDDLRGFEWHYLKRLAGFEQLLRAHQHGIGAVAVAQNGSLLASGDGYGTIELWDPTTGARLGRMNGHHKLSIERLTFSDDGQHLGSLATNNRGSVEYVIWDVPARRPQLTLRESSPTWAVAQALDLSRDGRTALTLAHPPNTAPELRVWRLTPDGSFNPTLLDGGPGVFAAALAPDGRTAAVLRNRPRDLMEVASVDLKAGAVRTVATVPGAVGHWLRYSQDGRFVAAGCARPGGLMVVEVWDVGTGVRHATLAGGAGLARAVAFAPDGDRIAAGWDDSTIRVWTADGGRELVYGAKDTGTVGWVTGLAISRAGVLAATLDSNLRGQSSTLRMWDVANSRTLPTPADVRRPARGVAFLPDGRRVAFGCQDGLVRLWDAGGAVPSEDIPAHHPAEAWCVAFSPDGGRLATGGDDSVVRLWDAATGARVSEFRGHQALVTGVAFSPDGRALASVDHGGAVRLWDPATGAVLWERARAHGEGDKRAVRGVAFRPDGKVLTTCGDDGETALWSAATGEPGGRIPGRHGGGRCVAYRPDGKLVTAGRGNRVRIWSEGEADPVGAAEVRAEVFGVAADPYGRWLAGGTSDGQVVIWDATDLKPRVNQIGHAAGVRAVAVSPDGRTLATGGADKAVRLWHPETGQELLAFTGLPSQVNGVAFRPDGRALAAALHDGSVRIWRAAPGD